MLVSGITFPYAYGISLSKEPYFLDITVDHYFSDPTLYRFRFNVSMRMSPADAWTTVPGEAFGDQTRSMKINLAPLFQDFIRNKSLISNDVLFNQSGEILRAFFYMRMDATEYYDGAPVLGTTSINDDFNYGNDYIVYEGGLPLEMRVINRDYFQWKATKFPLFPFHSTKPTTRITLPNQHQFLTYSRQDGSTDTFNLCVEIFINGTHADTIASAYTFNAAAAGFKLWTYDVNPKKLNILTLVPQATHYTVQMMYPDGFTPASERITYIIDRKFYKSTNYIIYKNHLSGFDTFTFRGETLQKLDYAREDNLITGISTSFSRNVLATSSVEETETFRFNTSFMGYEEIQELRHVLLSERIYIPLNTASYYPKMLFITPVTKSIELTDTSKFMQQNFVEFRRSYNNESFMRTNNYS